jgi:hypothetical protein
MSRKNVVESIRNAFSGDWPLGDIEAQDQLNAGCGFPEIAQALEGTNLRYHLSASGNHISIECADDLASRYRSSLAVLTGLVADVAFNSGGSHLRTRPVLGESLRNVIWRTHCVSHIGSLANLYLQPHEQVEWAQDILRAVNGLDPESASRVANAGSGRFSADIKITDPRVPDPDEPSVYQVDVSGEADVCEWVTDSLQRGVPLRDVAGSVRHLDWRFEVVGSRGVISGLRVRQLSRLTADLDGLLAKVNEFSADFEPHAVDQRDRLALACIRASDYRRQIFRFLLPDDESPPLIEEVLRQHGVSWDGAMNVEALDPGDVECHEE